MANRLFFLGDALAVIGLIGILVGFAAQLVMMKVANDEMLRNPQGPPRYIARRMCDFYRHHHPRSPLYAIWRYGFLGGLAVALIGVFVSNAGR